MTGLVLILVATLSTTINVSLERETLFLGLERQAGRMADLLAANVAAALFTINRERLTGTAAGIGSDPAIRFLSIRMPREQSSRAQAMIARNPLPLP